MVLKKIDLCINCKGKFDTVLSSIFVWGLTIMNFVWSLHSQELVAKIWIILNVWGTKLATYQLKSPKTLNVWLSTDIDPSHWLIKNAKKVIVQYIYPSWPIFIGYITTPLQIFLKTGNGYTSLPRLCPPQNS